MSSNNPQDNPQVARAIEWIEDRIASARTPAEAEAVRRATLALVARGDGFHAFDAFYYLIHGHYMPKHSIKWIEDYFRAIEEKKKGIVIEAFRGSWKTTTLTITFTAWWLGKHPASTALLVQVGDDIAHDNTLAISMIIQDHPGFKAVFPTVVPDPTRGWGAGGYFIRDTNVEPGKWSEMTAARKDPSLLGGGYKSREIIGKHPGLLVVDDIHDENNTSSEKELATVRTILTGTILPTMTKDTVAIFVGTPWKGNDALAFIRSTGQFLSIKTPVIDSEGRPVFPEVLDTAEIENKKVLSGAREFARMYMLDLAFSQNQVFKYQLYPHEQINWTWPMVAGVDYAGSMNEWRNQMGLGDFFAVAFALKLPQGGAVIADGILARCTQAEAETHIVKTQRLFSNLLIFVVEGDGRGEDFIQVLRRNPIMKLMPMKTGGKGKGIRFERHLGPWLENGRLRISDAETDFLVELRNELDQYPDLNHDDAIDAVYWAYRGMPDEFTPPSEKEDQDGLPAWITQGIVKAKHPFTSLARM